MLFGDLVAHLGYTPMTTSRGAEALELMETHPVDAVILDVMMPGLTGHDVLREMGARGMLPRIPVIIATALDERRERIALLEAGAIDFVTKPVDRVELQARLRTAVRLSQERRAIVRRGDAQERFAQDVLDSLCAFVTIVDDTGAVVASNSTWCGAEDAGVLGGRVALGANYFAACRAAPGGRDAVAVIRAALQGNTPGPLEYTCTRSDGQAWFSLRATPLCGSDDARVVVSHVDITRAQRARVEAARHVARLQLVVSSLPLVFWEAELVGDALVGRWASDNLGPTLGLPAASFVGSSVWFDELPVDVQHRLIAGLHRDPDETDPATWMETVHWQSTGQPPRLVDVGVQARAGQERVFGFFLDASESRAIEASLRQSHKVEAVGRLTGGIAHDFSNILGSVLTHASFVRDGLGPEDPLRVDVEHILRAAGKAAALNKQLLTFSRRDLDSRARPVNLRDAIGDQLTMLRRTFGSRIEIHFTQAPNAVHARIDPVHLDQIVVNLLVNARDAMPQGGLIAVDVSSSHDRAMISVTDSGTGMDSGTMEAAFDPFFTTKAPGHRTGLGLSTCLSIVRDVGGEIRVTSTPGLGSTFTVDLPRFEPGAVRADCGPVVRDTERLAGTSILLVEDDEGIRSGVERVLRGAGCKVTIAVDGSEAVALIDANGGTYDLVFSDAVMPGRTGFEVVEHARLHAPNAALLLSSGYYDRCQSVPEDVALLWKPYAPEELITAVLGALAAAPPRPTPQEDCVPA